MRKDVSHVDDLPIEMDRGNQSKFVAADIEHIKILDSIDPAERHLQISEARKVA